MARYPIFVICVDPERGQWMAFLDGNPMARKFSFMGPEQAILQVLKDAEIISITNMEELHQPVTAGTAAAH